MELTVFVLVILISATTHAQEWTKPYFLNPQTEGVSFSTATNNYQTIRMKEELPRPIKLAIINYKGSQPPTIEEFSVGSSLMLGASIIKDSMGQWVVQINERQDYENSAQQKYQFSVAVDSVKFSIYIVLQNIFDNDPTITYNGPCRAKELHSDYNTECIFQVYDRDGLAENKISLEVEGVNGEENIFTFRDSHQIDNYQIEYTLYVVKELHYEERALYNFKTNVFDIARNNGSITTIVEIEDLPNMDPIWVKPFATATFPEKQAQTFYVEAVDGDTGINKKIWYKLEFPEGNPLYASHFKIEKETGKLDVKPINRDMLKQDTFTFNICAYKFDNESWIIKSPAIIIVEDINDNLPEITLIPENVKFKEETYLTVPLEKFVVNDIDLGIHATYNVNLTQPDGTTVYSRAFDVIPNSGYQEANFRLSVANATLLDYEEPSWQKFYLHIVAQEINYPEHKTERRLLIELINLNDEKPIFLKQTYTKSLKETFEKNKIIDEVKATDRDIGDRVVHEIVGGIPGIEIKEDTGIISTVMDDVFDYEHQKTVILQIRATDTLQTYVGEPLNTAYAQLTINVIDVNDETPDIRMPRQTPNITENSPGNTLVTDAIVATDPDTTADLVFEIIWENSMATKSGQNAEKSTYENCFIIERHLENGNNRNKAFGHLKVNPNFKKQIDYESYEVIYLVIRVTDRNQEVREGSVEGTITIRVDDVNDNPPTFIDDTLKTKRSVVEEASSDTLIGTILAEDFDGPGNNIIKYYINPVNKNTPNDLISIETDTGSIRVSMDKAIDCDYPKIFYLEYLIRLTDGLNWSNGTIKIDIIDINNKKPQVVKPDDVEIYENATTGTFITHISATDIDRDYPHNKLEYLINYVQHPELAQFFAIETLAGDIMVKLQGNSILDRDNGKDKHEIFVTIEDNYQGNGAKNTNETSVTVILLDVNDNAPEMPDPSTFKLIVDENAIKDKIITPRIIATDIDDKNTPNAWVSYRILDIQPGEGHSSPIPDPNGIFEIFGDDKIWGQLRVAADSLQGFYGTWKIKIEAYDHGDIWDSRIIQRANETYDLTVTPFNFHTPKIVYPEASKIIRLRFDDQRAHTPLKMTNNKNLPSFEAEDPDGGEFGDIDFEISSYDADYFEIERETRNKSRLQLKTLNIAPKYYYLNVKAIDGGRKSAEITRLAIVFVDMEGDPVFDSPSAILNFTENELGLEEERYIQEARDPKNEGITDPQNILPIYYFLDEKFNPDDAKLFSLNKETRLLKLKEELDREEKDRYQIRVIATNNENKPTSNPDEHSILLVNITVNDVNDNPPSFVSKNYGAGITTSDYTGKPILTVYAVDPDLDDVVTYSMGTNEINAVGENIESFKRNMFKLNSQTGTINLDTPLKSNMKGFFEFQIVAEDLVKHTDTCNVKIYIVAEANRISFVFLTSYAAVVENIEFIKKTFNEFYSYTCNIDDVTEGKSDIERRDDGSDVVVTTVRVHFINDNEPIEASEILSRLNDFNFYARLKMAFEQKKLMLIDVPTDPGIEKTQNMDNLLTTVLAVVSVVLGTLCVVLIVAFFVRTRNLNRQLKAFSATDFGSTDSNLNRRGAPTTNVFSVEGSNPVLNNHEIPKDAFDTMSVESYESDFVGINHDPTFMVDEERKDSKNSTLISDIENNHQNIWQPEDNSDFNDDGSFENGSSCETGSDVRF